MSEDIIARIERLESIEQIKMLKHRYMLFCDQNYSPELLGPLFVDNAVWANSQQGHFAGREAIKGFFGGISSYVIFAAHLALNCIIDVDGDTARGKWRLLMPCTAMENGTKVSRWMVGDYDEEYVRVGGQWLFSKIDFLINFDVPSLESWAGKETAGRI
jgi:hypothetical protein